MLHPKSEALPAALATGTLAKRPLAHLLVYAVERALSGTFSFVAETSERASVVVERGMVARVTTTEPVVYLGQLLYESGQIDAAQLSASLADVASTRQLHGQVLLARGAIDRRQLADALTEQRARKLAHLFDLAPRTTFAFYADTDLVGPKPDDVPPMAPLPAIWRGIRTAPSWDHVRATIATVGMRGLRVHGSLAHLGLGEAELAAASRLLVTRTTVSELVVNAGLPPHLVDLLVYFLVITNVADVVDSQAPQVPIAGAASSLPRRPITRPGGLGPALPSGEYVRRVSFSMRAVSPDEGPLRIPSPIAAIALAPSPRSVSPAPSAPTRAPLPAPAPATLARPSRLTSMTPLAFAPVGPLAVRSATLPTTSASARGTSEPCAPSLPTEASRALDEAESSHRSGERERAVTLARKALTLAPGMPAATAFLAYLEAIAAGTTQEAYLRERLRMIDAAILKDETCRRGRFYRAEIRRRLRDHEGAIRDLRAAIRNDPDDVDAHRELNAYERRVHEGSVILRSVSPATGTVRVTAMTPSGTWIPDARDPSRKPRK